MSEQNQDAEMVLGAPVDSTPITARNPLKRLFGRAGCIILLVIWFSILTLPCFLIFLATQHEITIPQGGLPGQQIRIWLIMEADERGLGISSTLTQPFSNRGSQGLCLQTNVSYLLWQGSGENVSYCECYVTGQTDDNENQADWILSETYDSICPSQNR